MTMTDERAAWSLYWQTAEAGCLPGAPAALTDALASVWRGFAMSLPGGARLIDLATGNGAVPRAIAAARADIAITGVDTADLGTQMRPGTSQSGVDCAALPFAAQSFGAVTSQFGIEYCDVAALDEAARILVPGGHAMFVIHCADSVQIRQGQNRLAALTALREAGLFGLARRVAAGLGEDSATASAVANVRAKHSTQSITSELPQALGMALRSASRLAAVAAIEANAIAEMARLRAMASAARTAEQIDAMRARLGDCGLPVVVAPVTVPGVGQIAWTLCGQRTA